MPRAFIAVHIDPPPPLLEIVRSLAQMGGPVKTVPAENLHITLRFLGEVGEDQLEPIAAALRDSIASACVAPFDLMLTGLCAFPHADRPSVVWVGTRQAEPLHHIVDELNPRIDALNFGGDTRQWAAHLTLARVKTKPPADLGQMLRRLRSTTFGQVRIASVELMTSELKPTGAVHAVVSSVKL